MLKPRNDFLVVLEINLDCYVLASLSFYLSALTAKAVWGGMSLVGVTK